MVGFCGYGGSVWLMGEWAVSCSVGFMRFQKIFGLYNVEHNTAVEIIFFAYFIQINSITNNSKIQ